MSKNIMNFSSFVNENYTFEDFTAGDMEDVKDLYNEGLTDANEISKETGLSSETVTQILQTLKKRNDINESEVFDEYDDDQMTECGCKICRCVGECNCECCCDDKCNNEQELLYCKDCGEYIGGISPTNLCVGCSNKTDDEVDM